MTSRWGLRFLLVAAAVTTACVQDQPAAPQSRRGPDTVRIVSITPTPETQLYAGKNTTLTLEVEYELVSASSGTIALVVQRGESGHMPLATDTRFVSAGKGKVTFSQEVAVPDTTTLLVFTPLSLQGTSTTSIVDTRAFKVIKG